MNNQEISHPFLKTILTTKVILYPNQLNNEIYNNILNNLIKMLVGKCYKNYGFISNIYEIINISEGKIFQEDNNASVMYEVQFKCLIINPVENTIILCKVIQNTQDWLLVGNTPEPINVVIRHDKINNSKFNIDSSSSTIAFNGTKDSSMSQHILEENEFVKVRITATSFIDKDREILSLGYLEDIPTDDEIKLLYDHLYD